MVVMACWEAKVEAADGARGSVLGRPDVDMDSVKEPGGKHSRGEEREGGSVRDE